MEKVTESKILELAQTLQWTGSGIKNDPFTIESTEGLPSKFQIFKSNLFMIIKERNFKHIVLTGALNLVIKDSTLSISMYNCSNVIIDNCTIPTLLLQYCYGNTIKDSTLSKLFNYLSRGNQFKNNEITDQSIIENSKGCYILLSIALIITVIGFIASGFATQNLFTLILSISTIFLFIAIIIPYYRHFKKIKKLSSNQKGNNAINNTDYTKVNN